MDVVRLGEIEVRYLVEGPGAAFELVHWTTPAGVAPPPLHVHHRTDEGFYILSGTYGFTLGEDRIDAGAGAHVLVRRGSPHTFWNAGETTASCLIILSPSGFAPYFRELAAGLAGAETDDEAIEVRRRLSERFDMEVVSAT